MADVAARAQLNSTGLITGLAIAIHNFPEVCPPQVNRRGRRNGSNVGDAPVVCESRPGRQSRDKPKLEGDRAETELKRVPN